MFATNRAKQASLMMNSQVHYLPMTPGLFSILVILFAGLIILIQLRILRYAYMRLGVGPGTALLLLFGSLIGSYFNIPVAVLPGTPVRTGEIVDFYGMRYVVPLVTSWPGTVLAVNVGGAVIPTLMSSYLVLRYHLWFKAALAVVIIAAVIHIMATPGRGVGIAVPGSSPYHCNTRPFGSIVTGEDRLTFFGCVDFETFRHRAPPCMSLISAQALRASWRGEPPPIRRGVAPQACISGSIFLRSML